MKKKMMKKMDMPMKKSMTMKKEAPKKMMRESKAMKPSYREAMRPKMPNTTEKRKMMK